MHMKWKVIIWMLVGCAILFGVLFYVNEVRADVPSVLFNKLAQGYKLKSVGDSIAVYSVCDTTKYAKADFTSEELRKINRTWQKWIERNQDFKVWIAGYWYTDVGDIPAPTHTYKGHFIARQDKAEQIDPTKGTFKHTRTSLTQAQGQDWWLVRYYVNETGKAYLDTHFGNGNIHYYTNEECTMDSLRNYLNDINSVPRWTEDIP